MPLSVGECVIKEKTIEEIRAEIVEDLDRIGLPVFADTELDYIVCRVSYEIKRLQDVLFDIGGIKTDGCYDSKRTDSDDILDKLDSMLGSCDTTPRVCGNCKHFYPINSTCKFAMGEHGYNTPCECEEKFEAK